MKAEEISYWEIKLREDSSSLSSLKYFKPTQDLIHYGPLL